MTQPPDPNQQPPVAPGGFPPPQAPAPPMPAPAVPPDYAYGQPGAIPSGMYLDQASGLVLPQGVQLASIGRRIGAWFLGIPLVIVTLFIGYLIWGLIAWGKGTTPALQVLGMRCWRPEEGRVPGFGSMALREIIGRIAEGILSFITLLVSFILMLTSQKRQCLHDLVAGTVVVHDPNKVLG